MDLNNDLHVNPPRILAVCQVFRDRREAPTRLADAIDDPMPVETGDHVVDGDTTTAIRKLMARFDEFGEAMRRDAAGLVRSLQRYRNTEAATLRELEEVARGLERSGARPVLPAPPASGAPQAVPPPVTPRNPTWERVEAPINGNCAQRLGQPEGLRALGRALLQAGSGADDLIAGLRKQINDLVPADWRGDGATAFKQQIEQQLQTAKTGIVERSRTVGEAAGKCADRLGQAWVMYADAQALAMTNDLTIEANCWVVPHGPDTPAKRAAAERCLKLIEESGKEAAGAQAEFRMALAETWRDRMEIVRPLMLTGMAGMIAARARGRRTRTASVLRRLETQLSSAPRTKAGNVGPVPRHMLDANGQPGTDAGNLMHARIATFLQQQYPGVRFSVSVRPGETGADLRVIGRAPGVRDPGFDYLEIKPESPAGIRQFTQNQWGMPGFQGRGRMYTYDTAGNVYSVDTPHPF